MTFEEQGSHFLQWLKDNNSTVSESIGLKDYREEGAGRGVVAIKPIKEDEILFTIPRKILFSSKTSLLSTKEDMNSVLETLSGWTPLILCMMYEINNKESFWKPYFDVLPRTFTTPMFWPDLKSLEATGIIGKIGKEEADQIYDEQLIPIIKAHPALFDPKTHTKELFHICGSIIMAYSFHDESKESDYKNIDEDSDEDSDDEEEGIILMVPMADMLNHKTGYNNARLFYEPEELVMKAIKPIQEGEQIYNTYGDLCNADLLRKYGFTDEANPFDLCEIDGQTVMNLSCKKDDETLKEEKLTFLMEEGVMDDYFVIDTEHEIPEELIISVIVFNSSSDIFKKMASKSKLPPPKMNDEIKQIIIHILENRLAKYPTHLQEDLEAIQGTKDENEKNALRVKIGEKRILEETLKKYKKKRSLENNNNNESNKKIKEI
ncbi:unnamed protein product [Cunninghamella blakesleeana]